MALTRQCELAGVARSTVYAPHFIAIPNEMELLLLALIDAEYVEERKDHVSARRNSINKHTKSQLTIPLTPPSLSHTT